MLVLTRKRGEVIMIGDDIKLIVLDVDRGRVKLGFEADKKINIVREELLNKE